MEMSPDQRMVIAAGGGYFGLYDLVADTKIENIKRPAGHFYHVQRSPDGKTLALLGGSGNVNGKFSVYLTPFPILGDDTPPAKRLSEDDQRDLWKGLSSANLFRRRYVTKVFKLHAEQAVTLAAEKVKPTPAAVREQVVQLLKTLDDDDFRQRDAAVKKLRSLAFHFEPLLRATVDDGPSGEVRNRVQFVLGEISGQPLPADLLSDLRGIELLETLATSGARKLLQTLANGAPGARTTAAAAQALERMSKQKSDPQR
jgi:hypothetical protein